MGKDIQIRHLTEQDLPYAMHLKNSAGWNQVEEDWKGYLTFEREGCFLAEVEGEEAGTATAISYENKVSWIGMVLVDPSKRRLGVGSSLLRKCIDYLQANKIDSIKLDATPMGKKVYIPLGFKEEYDVTRYECEKVKVSDSQTIAQKVLPITNSDIDEIAKFDEQYFGVNRKKVLQTLHNRQSEYSFCVKDDTDKIIGYIMAHDGYEAVQVGPWVCRENCDAEGLFQSLLLAVNGKKVFLDVPCPNEKGIRLVEKYNFKVQRGFCRMYLGENNYPGQPERIYGTSGAEKG